MNKFVGLKSKMYSIKKIDGKEYNTAKGVLKRFYLMKKLLDIKWKQFKAKSIN